MMPNGEVMPHAHTQQCNVYNLPAKIGPSEKYLMFEPPTWRLPSAITAPLFFYSLARTVCACT